MKHFVDELCVADEFSLWDFSDKSMHCPPFSLAVLCFYSIMRGSIGGRILMNLNCIGYCFCSLLMQFMFYPFRVTFGMLWDCFIQVF